MLWASDSEGVISVGSIDEDGSSVITVSNAPGFHVCAPSKGSDVKPIRHSRRVIVLPSDVLLSPAFVMASGVRPCDS